MLLAWFVSRLQSEPTLAGSGDQLPPNMDASVAPVHGDSTPLDWASCVCSARWLSLCCMPPPAPQAVDRRRRRQVQLTMRLWPLDWPGLACTGLAWTGVQLLAWVVPAGCDFRMPHAALPLPLPHVHAACSIEKLIQFCTSFRLIKALGNASPSPGQRPFGGLWGF